jgi:hypothetical protein
MVKAALGFKDWALVERTGNGRKGNDKGKGNGSDNGKSKCKCNRNDNGKCKGSTAVHGLNGSNGMGGWSASGSFASLRMTCVVL